MLHNLILKLKWAVTCRSMLGRKDSYYPDEKHKSHFRIICDQFRFLLKGGYFEEYYYLYGFDRACMTWKRMSDYITPYRAFLNKVDQLNFQNPYFDAFQGRITGRIFDQDKYYFYLFLSRLGYPTPRIFYYVRKGRVIYEDEAFSSDFEALAKPVDGMMGDGIFFLCRHEGQLFMNGEPCSREDLDAIFASANYIVQERVIQHERLAALCPTSVNTLRMFTVMDREGRVISFCPILRIGRMGSLVDNWAKGGISVGVDTKSGTLMDRGSLKPGKGTVVFEHPDTHIRLEGYEIPFYREAEEMVIRLHGQMYRNHSIGWDVAISPQGPVIIEGNDRWEISLLQAAHGPVGYLKKYFYEPDKA
ncbi:MAG: hypothetical protein IKX53_03060 [Bacteroidales bacterium]|nr:hypothetical protein [Bacteroidales bacterium]